VDYVSLSFILIPIVSLILLFILNSGWKYLIEETPNGIIIAKHSFFSLDYWSITAATNFLYTAPGTNIKIIKDYYLYHGCKKDFGALLLNSLSQSGGFYSRKEHIQRCPDCGKNWPQLLINWYVSKVMLGEIDVPEKSNT